MSTRENLSSSKSVVSVDTSHADDVVRIGDKIAPLQSRDYKGGKLIMETSQKYVLENHPNDSRVKIREDGVFQTLSGRMGTGGNNTPMVMEEDKPTVHEKKSVVRRLTPLECERLQGFPDGWTDIGEWTDSKGKLHKDADSPRYKALGNSIALPFWEWMAKRMVDHLKEAGVENPTMGSLFDGISGFPLAFARSGALPVFSSEIEEFPIAVAKKHFGDDEKGSKGDYEKYL